MLPYLNGFSTLYSDLISPPPYRDLRANTEYQGYSPTSPVIRWFWEAVSELTAEDQALLLQFATGTSKVPLEGFKALQGIGGPQKFQIHKVSVLEGAREMFEGRDLADVSIKGSCG